MLDIKPVPIRINCLIKEMQVRLPKPLLRRISTWLDAQHQEMDTVQPAELQLAPHAVAVTEAIARTPHILLLPIPLQGMVSVDLVAVVDLVAAVNHAGRELAHPRCTLLPR